MKTKVVWYDVGTIYKEEKRGKNKKKSPQKRVLLPEMPPNPWKPCQGPTCPYASQVGVVEDRSVMMGFPDGSCGPTG